MTAQSLPQDSEAAGAAVFELQRFEWTAPDRIEVAGQWSGLRARRFIRPTLVLRGPGGPTRMLALLEHKPWEAIDGEEWVAAFPWDGDVVEIDSAELALATGIELRLPLPRPLPGAGKRPRWKAPKRIVAESIAPDEPARLPRQDAGVFTDEAEPSPAPAPEPEGTAPLPATEAVEAAPVARMPARETVDEITALRAERDAATAETAQASGALARLENELRSAREAHKAEVQRLEKDRDAAIRRLESERDAARDGQKAAIRERVDALRERDQATAERDEAVERLKDATTTASAAVADRDAAFRERDRAAAERDDALRRRDSADRDRDRAIEEREETLNERASARRAREMAERATPAPIERAGGSPMELWAPRLVALLILLAFVVVVALLFHGA